MPRTPQVGITPVSLPTPAPTTPAPRATRTPAHPKKPAHASLAKPKDHFDRPKTKEKLPILLYNDQCAVCRKISSWVIHNDDPKFGGHQLIDERPIGSDERALKKIDPRLNLWDVYAEIHLIMPDGTIKKGGEAIAEVFRRLPDTHWFAGAFKLGVGDVRPFQAALNQSYKLLDSLRPAIGCESCGSGAPVPWYGKPIEWAVRGYKKIR